MEVLLEKYMFLCALFKKKNKIKLNLCYTEKENQMWCWKVECLSALEVLNPALVYLCIF